MIMTKIRKADGFMNMADRYLKIRINLTYKNSLIYLITQYNILINYILIKLNTDFYNICLFFN